MVLLSDVKFSHIRRHHILKCLGKEGKDRAVCVLPLSKKELNELFVEHSNCSYNVTNLSDTQVDTVMKTDKINSFEHTLG